MTDGCRSSCPRPAAAARAPTRAAFRRRLLGLLHRRHQAVAAKQKLTLPQDLAIDAEVDLGTIPNAYGIAARLKVHLPGMDRAQAQQLVNDAHQVCPYSNATRGNIDVTLTLA